MKSTVSSARFEFNFLFYFYFLFIRENAWLLKFSLHHKRFRWWISKVVYPLKHRLCMLIGLMVHDFKWWTILLFFFFGKKKEKLFRTKCQQSISLENFRDFFFYMKYGCIVCEQKQTKLILKKVDGCKWAIHDKVQLLSFHRTARKISLTEWIKNPFTV